MSLSDYDPKQDQEIWRQDQQGLPQVTKAWDSRRRATQFLWESADPTAEQSSFKGVFTAAVSSLQETGFAVKRGISRMKEMRGERWVEVWMEKKGGD